MAMAGRRVGEVVECAKMLIQNACVSYFPSQVLRVINVREKIKTLKGWQ